MEWKVKGLKTEKRITPEGFEMKFIYKCIINTFISIDFSDIFPKEKEKGRVIDLSKEEKYYFVAYTKRIRRGGIDFCHDTIIGDPIQWFMNKCKKESPIILYTLIFYKEITFSQFRVFNPQYKIIKGSD